tara:strand:- start:1 stop:465 length:465 start_codon:yes stop_codon:yes gene_type:complete
MDQWFETGRQFVDGVAGTRPGTRRAGQTVGDGLDHLGRWVGNKIDWFFEEEDDWMESWELEQNDSTMNSAKTKKPLQAISRRGRQVIAPSNQARRISEEEDQYDDWPDESSFKVNRWERQEDKKSNQSGTIASDKRDSQRFTERRLPRSSRRRP